MFFELSVHDGQAPVRQAMLSGDSSCLRVEPYETGAASYFHLRVMSLGNVSRH